MIYAILAFFLASNFHKNDPKRVHPRNYAHGPRFIVFWHYDVIKLKHFPRNWPFVRGNSPVTCEFPAQRPVTRSFDVSLIYA